MPSADLLTRGEHTMNVCNSCRYCEQYCPVFPAMERRTSFTAGDLAYLANLCHNCGECLYACQYAPPHEFGIDVPRMFAEMRLASYEDHAWPRALARGFRAQGIAAALGMSALFAVVLAGATVRWNAEALTARRGDAVFYIVVPHGVMVALFGAVALFDVLAIVMALRAYRRTIGASWSPLALGTSLSAIRDGVTLRHLHGGGADCVSGEEVRSPWRRWAHHCTLAGFVLCFASTSVAAVYHVVLGWEAPYEMTSLPVLLGVAGGIGLVLGPMAQWWQRQRRDPALSDSAQHALDDALLLLLWLTSATGLLLLAFRTTVAMPWLLLVHLGTVLALFVSLPFGKFVHGLYRLVALAHDHTEARKARPH